MPLKNKQCINVLTIITIGAKKGRAARGRPQGMF